MCYSGRCLYETHMGDCRIRYFDKVRELTGKSACYIGGICEDEKEYKEFINDLNNGIINKYQNLIMENNLGF